MMTDREKLVELLCQATFGVNKQTIPSYLPPSAIAEVADHLIAHGVTFAKNATVESKWIPVSERLPETMNDVLCWYEYSRFGEYRRMFQKCGVGFCVHGAWGGEVAQGYNARVLYWMPLPEPPKEGE